MKFEIRVQNAKYVDFLPHDEFSHIWNQIDLGLNAFSSKIIYDRNIQALVDKILPEHAAQSVKKIELRKEMKIDLNVLFPDHQEEVCRVS